MSKFITVHVLNVLPLHNLNRDQNGLPKSQFDGGIQRGRLSAQSRKRAARVAFRDMGHDDSIRTRLGAEETLKLSIAYAAEKSLPFDEVNGRKAIRKVIDRLSMSEDVVKKAEKTAEKAAAERAAKKTEQTAEEKAAEKIGKNMIFLSRAELSTLAIATVEKQQNDESPVEADIVADATSPSLDIAAFGRMFADSAACGTHAAIAVSHANTTHQMTLTADYFSAVEDAEQEHAGAGHMGMAYYTSGVYYSSFTIDADQLRRSWSAVDSEGAQKTFSDLIKALVRALPSGKSTNSNPYTTPALVIAETQAFRTAYEFDTPVPADEEGGFKRGSIKALAEQRQQALTFDPTNFGSAVILGDTFGFDFDAKQVENLDALVAFVTDATFGESRR